MKSKIQSKTALIWGVNGQDGSLLAKLLLSLGYNVFGTSRDHLGSGLQNLKQLGIDHKVQILTMSPIDFRSVLLAFEISNCGEVYFLAGQTSVGHSFVQPAETLQSSIIGTLNILEAARVVKWRPKLYFAGSSESFGDTGGVEVSENTAFNPVSPYAVAKASSSMLVANYRAAYGIYACTGFLFNHESELRPTRFVTQKIVQNVVQISEGKSDSFQLGCLDIIRDWGWAEEYVDAMWRMLQCDEPTDFVIATGNSYSLQEFVQYAFRLFDMDWREHVQINTEFLRPSEIMVSKANPNKALEKLDWQASKTMHNVVELMVGAQLKLVRKT